eukprot:jgi/Mesvir1/8380/Mv12626-RA.1
MHLLRRWKVLNFPDFDLQVAKKVFPLTLCWWIYVVSGLTALRYLNVPMFGVLRRSTTAFVLLGEVALFRKWPSLDSVGAVALMIVGAMVAGFTDLTFSLPGYLYVFLCAISTAAYLLLIRLLKDKLQQSDAALLYYNNVVSLPMMVTYMALATDELHHVIEYPQLRSHSFQLFLLASCSQALLLNICIFRCTNMNSPLTTSVTGQLKDLLTTSLGFFLFGDVKYDVVNIAGLAIASPDMPYKEREGRCPMVVIQRHMYYLMPKVHEGDPE